LLSNSAVSLPEAAENSKKNPPVLFASQVFVVGEIAPSIFKLRLAACPSQPLALLKLLRPPFRHRFCRSDLSTVLDVAEKIFWITGAVAR